MHSRSYQVPCLVAPISLSTPLSGVGEGGEVRLHRDIAPCPSPPRQQGLFQNPAEFLGKAAWQDRGACRPT